MKLFKDFTIQQTMITTITIILAISVIVSVFAIYNINTRTTKELVNEQAREINKQIVLNYENYTNRVENMTNLIQKKIFTYDVDQDVEVLKDLFFTLEDIEDSIGAITLFDNSRQVIVATQQIRADSKEIALKEWYKRALFDDKIIHFSSPHEQDIFEVSMDEVISVSKVLEYNDNGITMKGILLIDMNFEGLDALSGITNLGETGHILILDAEDNIVYSSDKNEYSYNSDSYKIVTDNIFGTTNAVIDGTSMAVNINTISSTRWRIATFQNVNTIDEGMATALNAVVGVVVVTMTITIIVAYFVADQITSPLRKLDWAIIEFQKGIYDTKVEIEGQKEVKIVSVGFNAMIDKIHELMDEVVKEQEGKRQTELTILQNQINPHFLYNTLDCIIWLAEENRNDDLVETVGALSTFFRVSLSKGKRFIPISEELRHIESYMIIESVRYNEAFTYSIEFDPLLSDMKIMKLILQPLVENAIYHGIDKDDEESFIKIVVKEADDDVVLSVMNSGYGITDKRIDELYKTMDQGNDKGSVGMKNVYRRIKLFYGDNAKLIIESELDESTTISIVIPKDKMN